MAVLLPFIGIIFKKFFISYKLLWSRRLAQTLTSVTCVSHLQVLYLESEREKDHSELAAARLVLSLLKINQFWGIPCVHAMWITVQNFMQIGHRLCFWRSRLHGFSGRSNAVSFDRHAKRFWKRPFLTKRGAFRFKHDLIRARTIFPIATTGLLKLNVVSSTSFFPLFRFSKVQLPSKENFKQIEAGLIKNRHSL